MGRTSVEYDKTFANPYKWPWLLYKKIKMALLIQCNLWEWN